MWKTVMRYADTAALTWIEKKLKKYVVVFFDVFDTLLKRDVAEPTQVFSLLEARNRIPGFAESRIKAEISSRSRKTEVTLDDIYADALLKEYAWVKPLEIELELKLSRCNTPVKALYDRCVQSSKRIFIITDMYLPEPAIAAMLKKNGYGHYERLYVSGYEQASKITGDLFRKALRDNRLRAASVMHIGDNVHKDGFGAMKAGILPCLIRTGILESKFLYFLNIYKSVWSIKLFHIVSSINWKICNEMDLTICICRFQLDHFIGFNQNLTGCRYNIFLGI